ncbi:hypothetical protein PN435_15610 [Nodularia spumigena CS-590/02]|uniref:hypothetical protein n=1 Tax=Nodularia spumigena TaxID=70799 RepID=UPI00232B221B|nr:hypothetical protein [Nodularia spumigena]MDB9327569.1 hypothetical protein [Nodularia spumigena CS-590/02]
MLNKPNHTTQTNEILQSSALIQRLDKRRTQPIGLINTSQSERSLPRLPATIVQRFDLLEQIQTRYGVNNNSSGTGTELTFATPSPKTAGEQTNTFTSEAASFSTRRSANAQPGTSTLSSTSNQAPTAKFRISRKAVPLESESFPSKGGSEPLSSSTQPSNQETFPSDSSMIRLKRISNNDTKTLARNSEIPSNSQDLLTAREIPLKVDASTSPKATNKSPLVMLKATTEHLEEEIQRQPYLLAQPLANNIPSSTQTFSSTQAEANNPLVLRKNTTENLEEEIQRQPARVAVSREIPGNMASLPQSTMVWRKSSQFATPGNNFSDAGNGGTNNSLPLAIASVHHNRQAIARQTTPAPMSSTMPMSNPTMSMPRQTAMPIPEINVAEIAEQVSRILCRQLTVERERRGMRK